MVLLSATASRLFGAARENVGTGCWGQVMPVVCVSQGSGAGGVCEAAVRFAWLMDPDISSAKRLVRAAVALHFSAEERSKGVRALPAERFDPRIYRRCLTAAARSGTPSAT